MKMQKLVYFAHGWHLGLGDGPLIDGPVQAWDYGPVVPSLYRSLKPYGAGQITDLIRDFAPKDTGGFRVVAPELDDPDEVAFLERILAVYGKLSALQLSEMTHQPDTPWSRARAQHQGAPGVIIPDSMMEEYFAHLARQNAERQVQAARVAQLAEQDAQREDARP